MFFLYLFVFYSPDTVSGNSFAFSSISHFNILKNEMWRGYFYRIKHIPSNYLNQGFGIQISIIKTGSHWKIWKLF